MYTIFSLLIFLLIVIFSTLLYFKSKKSRQADLDNGICPACKATTKSFKDPNTGVLFKVEAIKTRVLKSHGCSGIKEIEYICNNCGLKEVHTSIRHATGAEAMVRFNEFENKIERMEAEAEMTVESNSSLESEFAKMEAGTDVDAELNALKKSMKKTTAPKADNK